MHRWIVSSLAAVLVASMIAGCQPPPSDYEVCSGYGRAAPSDAIWQCMGDREQRRSQALQLLLMSRQQQMVPYTPMTVQFQRPVTTNCMRTGNGISCSTQ